MYGMRSNSSGVNEFVSHNVASSSPSVIRHFDDYYRCYMGNGNGNLSNNDQYILFACITRNSARYTLISYDITNDIILDTRTANEEYNRAEFSHSGEYIVVDDSSGGSPDQIARYDKYLENELIVFDDPGHSDTGVDADGDDVIVRIRWDYIFYSKLSTGERFNLPFSDKSDNIVGGGHISCRAIHRPGWCYASTYSHDRIVAVKLSGDPNIAVTQT